METSLGANLGLEGTRASVLALWRPWCLGAFDNRERQLLAVIAPHLQRAFKISARLAQADLLEASLAASLDQLTHGVVLLDAQGRVQFLNRLAENIVAARDGLSMRQGALIAARPDQAAELKVAIQRALGTQRGAALQLVRPSGKRALTLLIAPLHVAIRTVELQPAAALVVITDPERGGVAPKQRLIDAYRLTPSEAALAMGLLLGHDLAAIADESGITYETARTHLRRVLIKTGAHRQADLIRLLTREVGLLI